MTQTFRPFSAVFSLLRRFNKNKNHFQIYLKKKKVLLVVTTDCVYGKFCACEKNNPSIAKRTDRFAHQATIDSLGMSKNKQLALAPTFPCL